jgi:hypothetical protein
MRGFRISVAGLMAFITFLGVAFASLHEATDGWSRGMFTAALAAYGLALLGLLFRRGIARAAWAGFFVSGAGSLAIFHGPWAEDHVMPHLLTTAAFDELYSQGEYTPAVGEPVWVPQGPPGHVTWFAGQVADLRRVSGVAEFWVTPYDDHPIRWYDATQIRAIGPDAYRRLWNANLSLLLAFAGAAIARLFAARSEREAATRSDVSSPEPPVSARH